MLQSGNCLTLSVFTQIVTYLLFSLPAMFPWYGVQYYCNSDIDEIHISFYHSKGFYLYSEYNIKRFFYHMYIPHNMINITPTGWLKCEGQHNPWHRVASCPLGIFSYFIQHQNKSCKRARHFAWGYAEYISIYKSFSLFFRIKQMASVV